MRALLYTSALLVLAALPTAGVSAAEAPPNAVVRIKFQPRDVGGVPDGVVMVRNPERDQLAVAIAAAAGQPVVLIRPGQSRWLVRYVARGWWSPETLLVFPDSGSVDRKISVWRSSSLHGTVKVVGNAALPATLRVTIASPPNPVGKTEIPADTEFQCSVDAGRLSCEVPATALDLSLRAKGFAPIYRWAVRNEAGHATELGSLALRPGGSLIAWLDLRAAKQLTAPATGTIVRMVVPTPSATAWRLSVPLATGSFDQRGVLQLASLSPGTFSLIVTAKGFAATTVSPIEIYEGSESSLRKVIDLRRPAMMALQITPANDPGGGKWQVEIHRASDFSGSDDSQAALAGSPDPQGRLVMHDAPGRFLVVISDPKGNHVYRRHHSFAENETVPITIASTAVKGVVRFGESPVAGTLWFGGSNGAVTVKLESDAEGKFSGVLPESGRWRVQVVAPTIGIDTTILAEASERMNINLPDNEISGRVVDAAGQGSGTAEALLLSSFASATMRTALDGSFRFRSIAPGAVRLSARDLRSGRITNVAAVQVVGDEDHQDIELLLESNRSFSGRLSSGGVPVIGARVSVYSYSGGSARRVQAVSDVEGHFEVNISEPSRSALVIVSAPGRVLQAYSVDVSPESTAELTVAPQGGALVLTLPKDKSPLSIAVGGTKLPLTELYDWAEGVGGAISDEEMTFPSLAPGAYRACVKVPGEKGSSDRCADAWVSSGAIVRINLRDR